MKFNELGLPNSILSALDKIGFEEATPIQSEAIPMARTGKDLIGQAQTGTGKTFSFGIPMIEKLEGMNTPFAGLIICPTRELAVQVNTEIEKITKNIKGIKTALVYGGQAYPVQLKALKREPQIVIGTPGRIMDHLKRKSMNFRNLQMVILDEADEMLKMGFEDDIRTILEDSPKTRQTLLFSATMPPNIRKIANEYLTDPNHIKIAAKELTVDRIKQVCYEVNEQNKFNLLIRLLDFYSFRSSVIFCNTKRGVDELASKLEKYSFRSDGLHGDLSQHQRDRVMNNFRNKNLDILVATDVAARGIDVKDVDVVFNYDLPQEEEFYVHRIGRTGRAGRKGMSISFVNGKQRGRLKAIEKYAKTSIERASVPSVSDVHNARLLNKFETIKGNINLEKTNDLYQAFVDSGLSDKEVINGLINTLASDVREYPEIRTDVRRNDSRGDSRGNSRGSRGNSRGDRGDRGPRNRDRDRGNRREKRQSGEKGFVRLNIGKDDKVRPQILLSYLRNKTDIDPRDIGDIRIRRRETYCEVSGSVAKLVSELSSKEYKGKSLKVDKVDHMD